jgi:hypothetical protein
MPTTPAVPDAIRSMPARVSAVPLAGAHTQVEFFRGIAGGSAGAADVERSEDVSARPPVFAACAWLLMTMA